jgi:hypothetical protein
MRCALVLPNSFCTIAASSEPESLGPTSTCPIKQQHRYALRVITTKQFPHHRRKFRAGVAQLVLHLTNQLAPTLCVIPCQTAAASATAALCLLIITIINILMPVNRVVFHNKDPYWYSVMQDFAAGEMRFILFAVATPPGVHPGQQGVSIPQAKS